MKKARILLTLCLVAALAVGMALSVSADEPQNTNIVVETLPVVEAGQPIADYTYTPPAGEWNEGAYTVTGTWHLYDPADGSFTEASGTFQENSIYQLRLTATLNPAWGTLDNGLYVSNPGEQYEYWYEPQDGGLNYVATVALGDFIRCSGVYLTGLPESITAGAEISAPTVTQDTEAMGVDSVHITARWVNADGTPASGTFQNGKVYYIEVTAQPKAGYMLDSYINMFDHSVGMNAHGHSDGLSFTGQFRYSLLNRITSVEITGVTEPVIGATPTTDGIQVPTGANYTLESISWEKENDDSEWTVFEDQNAYYLWLYIIPKDGCEFATDATVTVNGQPLEVYPQPEGTWIRVRYSLLQKIEAVDIQITAPTVDATASLDAVTLPAGLKLDEENSYWYEWVEGPEGQEQQKVTGTFQKGHKYYLTLRFETVQGYEIAEDATLTCNGQPMNWNTLEGYVWTFGGNLQATYSFLDVVSEVKITGVTAPVIGATPTVEGIQITGGTLTNAVWYVEGEHGWEPVEGVFEAGKAYNLDIYFKPAQGAEFGEGCVVYLDGEKMTDNANAWGDYGNVWPRYSFKTVIDKVEVTGMPQYAVGGTASVESLKVPQDANYTLNAFWQSNESDNFTGTFENNNIYRLVILVEPKDGYEFSKDTQLLIDGQAPATNWTGSWPDYVYALYYFRPGATVLDKVEVTAPTPVIGADIKNEDIKAPADAGYTVEGWWMVSTNGRDWREATGKFEEGKYYRVDVYVETDMEANVYMADNVQILLNGVAAEELMEANPNNAYVTYDQGRLCIHTYGTPVSDGKDTHTGTCTKCGDKVTENHVWESDKDGKCDTCGYTRSDNPPTGDMGIALAVVTALASLSGAILLKKKEF